MEEKIDEGVDSVSVQLRKMTPLGVSEFERYLREDVRGATKLPQHQFNEEPYSVKMRTPSIIQINPSKKFSSRRDLAAHVSQKLTLGGVSREDIIVKDPEEWNNVWNWLSSVWLDQFIKKKNGQYTVPAINRFIGTTDYRRFYRHFIATPYWLYTLHGYDDTKLFLECPVNIHNDFIEQMGSRQWIISCFTLVDIAHQLYWNEVNYKGKRGARGRGAGSVRRFVKICNQLYLNYDITSLDAEKILDLLPPEFDKWQ